MRGALYAATEIVVFLLIATFIGVVIGRLWAAATTRQPVTRAVFPSRLTWFSIFIRSLSSRG